MHLELIRFIRELYETTAFIPLHQPTFQGNEKRYVEATIDSTFVSSVGEYVKQFEAGLAEYCQSAASVAVVNGTSALQAALHIAGVQPNDLVITQSLTFVATCNAIHWLGAHPIFVDVSLTTLGMCPVSLAQFLASHCRKIDGQCIHMASGKRVKAVVPMHTFGHPADVPAIASVCRTWQIPLIEDAAESLGSTMNGQHTGTFGAFGALSFNGNKIITTGGGGAVLCQSISDATRLKHFTTTAKVAHDYEFVHDDYACNARMPNLNAALGVAQLEQLERFLARKRDVAAHYARFFNHSSFQFVAEPEGCRSNFWLNAILCEDKNERDALLQLAVSQSVMMRPVWKPMHQLAMFANCIASDLTNTEWLADRLVNLPSSVLVQK